MARTLREDCTELYRAVVTHEWGRWDYDHVEFSPTPSEDGTSVKNTVYRGPYDKKSTASTAASSVVPHYSRSKRLIESRIQRLTPVAFETVKTDEFGNQDVKVSAELRWMDV